MAYGALVVAPLHTIVETGPYLDDCRAEGVSDPLRGEIVDMLARDPKSGALIKDSGGARKVRVAGRGRGKSGGYRVITAFVADHAPLYLLALYSKGEKANLSAVDLKTIRVLVAVLKKYWSQV